MTRFLAACRYVLVLPIVGCVLLTAGIVLVGVVRIFSSGAEFVRNGDVSAKAAKLMSLAVIQIIDLFLIGTVSYITAVGLYKLFISKAEIELPVRLKIRSLKDLEEKIIGVIVAALAVAFLGKATGDYEPQTLLSFGGGIALVVAALGLFVFLANKANASNLDSRNRTSATAEEETVG